MFHDERRSGGQPFEQPASSSGNWLPWWFLLIPLMNAVRSCGSHSSSWSLSGDDVLPVVIIIAVAIGIIVLLVFFVGRSERTPTPRRAPQQTAPRRTRPGLWDDTVDGPFFP